MGEQAPLTHAVAPFALVHAAPQAPQLVVVASDASQPLEETASQSLYPESQAIEHPPRTHDGVPWLLLQTAPQLPQLLTVPSVNTSHPFAASPSQFV